MSTADDMSDYLTFDLARTEKLAQIAREQMTKDSVLKASK